MAEYGCPHCRANTNFSLTEICKAVHEGNFNSDGEFTYDSLFECEEAGYPGLPEPFYQCANCSKTFANPIKI